MTEHLNNHQRNYYADAMRIIESNEYTKHQYMQLSDNESWKSRFCDYLRGKKTLPLLYDPFFKAIFNPDTNKDSLANIEVQKAPFLFPAERISCYSSDLMMRQYNRIKNISQSGKKFSYKDLHRVHTIIFYENSSNCLKSSLDEKLYFHVGKTIFNTGINIELLQDFHLISLDTFKKYRLLSIYPELEDIVKDMNTYLTQPEEVLNMFSESLRILDKNSMDLLIDETIERAEKAEADAKQAELKAKQAENKAKLAENKAQLAEAKADKIAADAKQEIDRLKKEIEELKHQ